MKPGIRLAVLLLFGLSACIRAAKQGDLIYKGTVTKIEIADTGNPLRQWVVTTRVDRVVCGSFSGSQFQFAIHSPAQSGIEVGKQYRIVAARVAEGYLVERADPIRAATTSGSTRWRGGARASR